MIISLQDVHGRLATPMHFGHLRLEVYNPRCPGFGVRQSDELQHRGDVSPVLATDIRHFGGWIEVVTAVGHSESALEDKGGVPVRMIEVLGDP